MSSSVYCRASALGFFALLIPSFASAEQPSERTMVIATNQLTSKRDSLSACKVRENGSVTSCQEFTTDIPLNNPIGLASNKTSLFVLNYGFPGASIGTSFILKCNLPKFGDSRVSCQSVMAYANRSHMTGMNVVGEKIFLTQSYSYGDSNFNYVRACDLIDNVRTLHCGTPVFLQSDHVPNPQSGTNITMNIAIDDTNIFIVDHFGRTTFQCTQPKAENAMTCASQSVSKATTDSKFFPIALDMQGNYSGRIESNAVELNTPSRLIFCANQNQLKSVLKPESKCQTLENSNFFQPKTLTIDVEGQVLYLANTFNTFSESSETLNSISYCKIGNFENDNTIQDCQYNNPDFQDSDGVQTAIGTISALHIFNGSLR